MHEVSVPFDVLLHYLHLPPLIPHQPQAVPVTLLRPRGHVVTLSSAVRRWCLRTNPSPTQVMSPTTTSSRKRRPGNGTPSNGSSRITTMPQSGRCSSMHTENKSITPSEKACLLVSHRRPCPRDRGNPLWKQVKN